MPSKKKFCGRAPMTMKLRTPFLEALASVPKHPLAKPQFEQRSCRWRTVASSRRTDMTSALERGWNLRLWLRRRKLTYGFEPLHAAPKNWTMKLANKQFERTVVHGGPPLGAQEMVRPAPAICSGAGRSTGR